MLKRFYPNDYVPAINELTSAYFKDHHIRGVIFDLDNTLTPWNSLNINAETLTYLKSLSDAGLKVCIMSNGVNKRVEPVLFTLGLPGISKARKPLRRSFRKALEILGTGPGETAVVGDQVFTDVLGGNRMGMFTVLVNPVSKLEFTGTKVNRLFEKIVLGRMKKNK